MALQDGIIECIEIKTKEKRYPVITRKSCLRCHKSNDVEFYPVPNTNSYKGQLKCECGEVSEFFDNTTWI